MDGTVRVVTGLAPLDAFRWRSLYELLESALERLRAFISPNLPSRIDKAIALRHLVPNSLLLHGRIMHLCFVDESGTPPKRSAKNPRPYFVIAGLIISEQQWKGVSDELTALKRSPKFRVNGEIKWRYFGAQNTDPDNSVAHLDQSQKDDFRTHLYSILTSRKSIKIIACVSSVAACYTTASYVANEDQLYNFTYKRVSERFQYFLQDISRSAGSTHHGLIVADHRGRQQDEGFRRHHHRLINQEGFFTSDYPNLVETIFLTPSHHSVGIQLVDMVAGAIGRNFNSGDPKFFDQLVPAFRSGPSGCIDGYGLVKFPKTGWV